jgi:hypothetical protein
MKNSYLGYYVLTSVEANAIWEDCIFALDANVLLNLYRYSNDTSNDFIALLDQIKDRLFLPHRSGYEYHRNRLDVISKERQNYETTIKNIDNIINEFNSFGSSHKSVHGSRHR